MSRILDGASVSLDRQLDMIRFIFKNNNKGVKFDEIHLYIAVRHGLTKGWVVQYLKQWTGWGIVQQKGTKFYVNEDKWNTVLRLREEGFEIYGP